LSALFGGFFSNLFIALGTVPEGVMMTLAEVKKAGVPVFAYGSFLSVLLNFVIWRSSSSSW
jgi:large conductance mechanosensitive channel